MKELATQHSYKVSTLLSAAGHPADLHSSHVHMEKKKSDGGEIKSEKCSIFVKEGKNSK